MQLSDGLAVAAIVLALFTILLGILFYKWQSDLAKEMHGLLGKIEGMTTSTREQQQEQFKQLLDFALGHQRASIGQELQESVAEIERRIAGLEERSRAGAEGAVAGREGDLSPEAKAQMDGLMEELKGEVESLAKDIEALRQSAPPQPRPVARLAGEGSVGYSMHHYYVPGFGTTAPGYAAFPIDVVDLLREVKSMTDSRGRSDTGTLSQRHRPKVMTLGSALGVALKEGLLSLEMSPDASEVSVALTAKGRELLEIIGDADLRGVDEDASR